VLVLTKSHEALLAQTCGGLVWDRRVLGRTVRKETTLLARNGHRFFDKTVRARRENKVTTYVMTKPCPVRKQQLTKKVPTDTVRCACGQHIWQG
jgi:hypothetical protein